jgi:hypothetical protein
MPLKLYIVPVKNLSVPEGEMNAFLRAHRVLAVRKEFVSDGENSFWTFCVEYLESAPTGPGAPGGKLPKVDYKEVLKPEEFEVFSRLRDWRKAEAEKEGVPVYVVFTNEHYMDDFVVWGGSGRELRAVCERVQAFLTAELKLELKTNTAINRTAFGMDFLGYRLFPGTVGLARRSKVRFTRKFRRYEAAQSCGRWSELVLQQRMQALLAFVIPAESGAFRRHVLQRFGVAAIRLQPCESGRQLEQQRDQLPDGEPQQQQPEQQQQHRVPFRPAHSSAPTPDGAGADPAAILSGT